MCVACKSRFDKDFEKAFETASSITDLDIHDHMLDAVRHAMDCRSNATSLPSDIDFHEKHLSIVRFVDAMLKEAGPDKVIRAICAMQCPYWEIVALCTVAKKSK